MRTLILKLLMGLVLVAGFGQANAAPYIDPALRPLWTQANPNDTRPIVLIIMFKDLAPGPRLANSQANRPAVEASLRYNAMVSQKATLEKIQSFVASGTQIAGAQLWLINGIVLQLPVNKMQTLAADPNVTAIYANEVAHIIQPYRSPRLAEGKFTYGLEKIGIPEIRTRAPQLIGTGVRVGILDTGIDATHPDLKDRTIAFKDFTSNKQAPYDDHGHGTHVAGTISGGAASGTEIGIAPGVKLIVGKVFTAQGSGDRAQILLGMQWMADPDGNPQTPDHPHLVSNSWGGGRPTLTEDPAEVPYCKAVASWVKLGTLPVFANGNSGPGSKSVGLPAGCPQALAVGATDEADAIAQFSSRGPAVWKTGEFIKPDVSAPGVKVKSSTPNGGYDSWSGTSMATPHVAGMAALMYQVNPNLTYEQAVTLIKTRAKDLGAPGNDNEFGMGRIDAPNTIKTLLSLGRGFLGYFGL